ncbi:MAG: PilZ domain-containing protein [Acidiferrobacterales bacterium]
MSGRELVSTSKPSLANRRLVSANRRLGPRRVTDVKVFVSDGSEIKKCRLRDISLDGAFIETKNFALAKDSKVDLILRIQRDGETSACRVPAKVVRTERGGAALMFASLEEDVYNILLKIVNRQGNRGVTSQS